MSLMRNDMLTTGNNRRARRRGTVRVSEPSYGFFIAGSNVKVGSSVAIAVKLAWFDGKAAGTISILKVFPLCLIVMRIVYTTADESCPFLTH